MGAGPGARLRVLQRRGGAGGDPGADRVWHSAGLCTRDDDRAQIMRSQRRSKEVAVAPLAAPTPTLPRRGPPLSSAKLSGGRMIQGISLRRGPAGTLQRGTGRMSARFCPYVQVHHAASRSDPPRTTSPRVSAARIGAPGSLCAECRSAGRGRSSGHRPADGELPFRQRHVLRRQRQRLRHDGPLRMRGRRLHAPGGV